MRLAILIRSHPYRHRVARSELDVALAAVALDYPIEIFFEGAAILQLLVQREPAAAGLPGGLRGWAALPELGAVRIFAEQRWLERCEQRQLQLLLPAEPLSPDDLRRRWRQCAQAIVL
mgnify:CR=1 FL=1